VIGGLFVALVAWGYVTDQHIDSWTIRDVMESNGALDEASLPGIPDRDSFRAASKPIKCEVGWVATQNCNPFGQLAQEKGLPCDSVVTERTSGYCHCSQGIITSRFGCQPRAPFTCREDCEAMEREVVGLQRRARGASQLRAVLRSPRLLRRLPGWRLGDLEAMTNTGRCQLLRKLHASPGLDSAVNVDGKPPSIPVPLVDYAAAVAEDFQPWSGGFTKRQVWETGAKHHLTNVLMIVRISNGTFSLPDRRYDAALCGDQAHNECVILDMDGNPTGATYGLDYVNHAMLRELDGAIKNGEMQAPDRDIDFLFTGEDTAEICSRQALLTDCPAPVFSNIQRRDHQEIMVPQMSEVTDDVPYSAPWDDKEEVAFFRGVGWCGQHPIAGRPDWYGPCSRNSLPELSERYPDLLNVSMKQNDTDYNVAIQEHARWKYLLQLDGITASYRFYKLLLSNSVVLKQESTWNEYFYRWLAPCVHYIPFWTLSQDDILEEVVALRQADDLAREVAEAAQALAKEHLGRSGRLRYWQQLLDTYASLYRDE